jgi:two-component system, cell cycle sensor histidine kinase and response regulator CckA
MKKPSQGYITQRLILSLAVLISILLLFGLLTIYDNYTVSRLTRTIYNHPLVVSNAALQSNISITKMHRHMKDVVLFNSPERISHSIEAVNQQEKLAYQYLDIVKDNILGDEGRILERKTRVLFEKWRPIREEVIRLVRGNQRHRAAEITIGKGADHVAELEENLLGLTRYARNKASSFMGEAEKAHSRVNATTILFLLSGIFASSLIAFFTLRQTASSEKELRESRQLLMNAIDFAPIGMVMVEPGGNFFRVNHAFAEMTGYPEEELLKMSFQDVTHPDDYDIGTEITDSLIRGETGRSGLEKKYVKKDGSIINAGLTTTLLKDKDGNPLYFFSQVQDITARKQAEEALQESEEKYRSMMEAMDDPVYICSSDLRIMYMNPAMIRLIGRDAAGDSCHKAIHGLDEKCPACVQKNVMNGETIKRETILKKDGKTYHVSNSPIFHTDGSVSKLTIFRDVSELKKIEAQLRQAQKLESVGRLAGGVAHDYNNSLSVIIGFTELAMEDVSPAGPVRANLDEVLAAAKHAADITRQLLAFARKQNISPKVIDLNKNVETMLKMLRHLIGEDIDLAWLPGATLWPVKMDPAQSDQILANLCVNARDAITGVGKVIIETDNAVFDEVYCASHTGFVPGEFVMLAVSDNGCGMEKEKLENIFEPFFTTKDVNEGTGLGLATVYGIVKQNNGFINVYSEPGKGTTIKIYLSRHKDASTGFSEDTMGEIPPGRGETILLVEDDLSILKLAERILDGLGYCVLAAGTPDEAMGVSGEYTGKIHLLVTDVIMPEMNGRELSKRMQLRHPDLATLFMSGYTANVIAHHGVLDESVHFIQKPFSKKKLAIAVRKVLDV